MAIEQRILHTLVLLIKDNQYDESGEYDDTPFSNDNGDVLNTFKNMFNMK